MSGLDNMAGLDEMGLVKGRDCGTCTLCCKVLKIDWLTPPKAGGIWCKHCQPGKGCAIWQARPQGCADYHCLWRRNPQLGDEWRPDRAGFLISEESQTLPFTVVADPGKPDSWRKEPYYSGLKVAAKSAIMQQRAMVILVAGRQWVILPDGDVPVPHGLENTDFSLSQGADGRWKVTFLGTTKPATQ